MLDNHTADTKLAASQEQFMSSDKLSTDATDGTITESRSRTPSALMRVANTIDTSVDSSLDAFIAEANSTLDNIGGWGINDESSAAKTDDDLADAEARAAAAEQRADSIERQTQSKLTSAQSQLAEAEARVAAAEQRAAMAEKAAKSAKTNLMASAVAKKQQARQVVAEAAHPAAVPIVVAAPVVAPAPVVAAPVEAFGMALHETKSKPKLGMMLGVFVAGGLLAFGAAKFMVGNADSDSANAPAPAPAATVAPAVAPVAEPQVEALPAVKSLAATPDEEVVPEVVPLDTGEDKAAELAAAAEAERLAEDAAATKLEAELLAQEKAAAKAAAEAAVATKAKKSAKSAPKAKPVKKVKKKAPKPDKKAKEPTKPKGGIVDPFA